MAQATYHFPRNFLWGTATASHQVEGNNTNNNWWAWEQEDGHILGGAKSGLACDWWGGRWREDFDRAAESGQNAHRLSIEWSRVQPAPDRWDEDAIDRYIEILRGLKETEYQPTGYPAPFHRPALACGDGRLGKREGCELFCRLYRESGRSLERICKHLDNDQ